MTGIMIWNVYGHVRTLRNSGSSPAEHRSAVVPFDPAVPADVGQPPAEPTDTSTDEVKNDMSPSAPTKERGRNAVSPSAGKPAEKKPAAPSSTIDLSAYRVRARRASGEDYLPADGSLSPEQVKKAVNNGRNEEDWGKGIVGDVVRGTQKIVKQADDATLDASRKALGTMASPDSAKIRPNGDGVRLHISIPTD